MAKVFDPLDYENLAKSVAAVPMAKEENKQYEDRPK